MTKIVFLQSPPPKLVEVQKSVFSPGAIEFLAKLHKSFDYNIETLYRGRLERNVAFKTKVNLQFKKSFERSDKSWKVAPVPSRLEYV